MQQQQQQMLGRRQLPTPQQLQRPSSSLQLCCSCGCSRCLLLLWTPHLLGVAPRHSSTMVLLLCCLGACVLMAAVWCWLLASTGVWVLLRW
jgi:hypothetical protein